MQQVFAKLPSLVRAAAMTLLVGLSGTVAAQAAGTDSGDQQETMTTVDEDLAKLSRDELEELFVFVAGNALFTLYHEGGHMLIAELGLPVLAQEEDAVDNLATLSMLDADSDDMDTYLTQAMYGWFLIADEAYEDLVFYDEHDLDKQRGYTMLCLMVGADEDAFVELAKELDLPEERIETCGFDYDQAAASWEFVTEPFLRENDTPGGKIKVVHDPAPEGLEAVALFLKESALMELVAEELDTFYELPEEVTFRATTCGMENAFWDPDKREVVLCHELLGGFADIFLSLPAEDQDGE